MSSSFRSLKDVFKREKSLHALRELVDSSDVVVKFHLIFPNLEKVAIPLSCEKKNIEAENRKPGMEERAEIYGSQNDRKNKSIF